MLEAQQVFDFVGVIELPSVGAAVPFEAILCGTTLLVSMTISAPTIEAPEKLKMLALAIKASINDCKPFKVKTVQIAWSDSITNVTL